MDRILVRKLAKTLLEYPLDKDKTRIGRDPGNDIVLAGDLNISESHAEVQKRPTGGYIVDLDTLNGTFLNGEIIIKEKELRDGDKITIGQYTLVCRCGDEVNTAEDAASVVSAPEAPPEAAKPPAEIIPAAEPAPGLPAADKEEPAAVASYPEASPVEAPVPEIIPAAEPVLELPAADKEEPAAAASTPEVSPAETPAPEVVPVTEPAAEPPAAAEEPAAAASVPEVPPEAETPAPEIIPSTEPVPETPPAAAEANDAAASIPEVPPEAETPAPELIPAEPAPAPAPEPAAADMDDSFAATIMKAPKAETTAPEMISAEPAQEPPTGGNDDSFESTSILKVPQAEAPVPELIPVEPEPQAVETKDSSPAAPAAARAAAPPDTSDRFAITSILKVPRKMKPAPGAASAAPDLEEGVIEIEVQETPFWSKKRLTKAAILTGAAGCAIFVLAVLRSADFRARLVPGSQISFNVVPDDAQVYVNGAEMPKPGSGVLRNLPAGKFTVKVLHSSYPAARTLDIETGLFKRRVVVESAPGGISIK